MSKTFRAWMIDQPQLLPPTVGDFVGPGHLARFVLNLVTDELDLIKITGTYGAAKGQPPFHPVMMVALLLYAYCSGIYSSRRIAKACRERVDFMSIVALEPPDFRTISDFRKRHLAALSAVFVQVLKLCETAGLVKLGHVALDGSKIKANASKHKAMSYERMEKRAAELDAEVANWLAAAAAADATEDNKHGATKTGATKTGDEMPDWVADKKKRAEKIRTAKAELEAEAKAAAAAKAKTEAEADEQRKAAGRKKPGPPAAPPSSEPAATAQKNFTDPESRIMKSKDGFIQGYNAQAAVDAEAQVIVAQDVTQCPVDQGQLVPLTDMIEANLGRKPAQLSADAGYCSDANLAALETRGIDGTIATGRAKHAAGPAATQHAAVADVMTADDGAGSPATSATDTAAPGMPEQNIATPTRVEAMREKIKAGGFASPYRLRKQLPEPVFGQIKQARGFRQFLLRGIEKVAAEWSLVCTAHNLLKLAHGRTPSAGRPMVTGAPVAA